MYSFLEQVIFLECFIRVCKYTLTVLLESIDLFLTNESSYFTQYAGMIHFQPWFVYSYLRVDTVEKLA